MVILIYFLLKKVNGFSKIVPLECMPYMIINNNRYIVILTYNRFKWSFNITHNYSNLKSHGIL